MSADEDHRALAATFWGRVNMVDGPNRVHLTLAPTVHAPSFARRRVGALCEGVPGEQRHVIELLVSELVTNAVLHPSRSRPGSEDPVEVDVERSTRRIRVAVRDHDPRPLPTPRQTTAAAESGRGLGLLDALASRWACDPGPAKGKTVWFELQLTDEPADLATREPRAAGSGVTDPPP